MIVLVDYYNLPELLRRRGLSIVVETLLQTIGIGSLSANHRVRMKLYGGWYEGNRLTKAAQQLLKELASYPKAVKVHGLINSEAASIDLRVTVELARSMEIDPLIVIEDTYRERGMPEGLRCTSPPYTFCNNSSSCPLVDVYDFIDAEICPEPRCRVTPSDLLRRAEQKLVDTMIIADLIHLARDSSNEICIISSDDDLWPGIKSALLLGRNIIHIQTIRDRITPTRYSKTAGPNYKQLNLR